VQRFPSLEKSIDGRPVVIVCDGAIDHQAMRRLRVDEDDLLEAARREGLPNLAHVRHAVLEGTGKTSIVPKDRQAAG
jgi:uncharacterized membrane protein YcaP (DUF421 family)